MQQNLLFLDVLVFEFNEINIERNQPLLVYQVQYINTSTCLRPVSELPGWAMFQHTSPHIRWFRLGITEALRYFSRVSHTLDSTGLNTFTACNGALNVVQSNKIRTRSHNSLVFGSKKSYSIKPLFYITQITYLEELSGFPNHRNFCLSQFMLTSKKMTISH